MKKVFYSIYIKIWLFIAALMPGGLGAPADAAEILKVMPQISSKTMLVSIGTGGVSGAYYPAAAAISRLVNAKRRVYGIRCAVEPTSGSVFNVNAVMARDLEFGIVQSDDQYRAVMGIEEWAAKGPQKDLRALFSLYPEAVTLIASVESDIRTPTDMKGKRVAVGNPGSGQRRNAMDVLSAFGLSHEKDLMLMETRAAEAPGLFRDGRVDAFFYTVGHPNAAITEAMTGRIPIRFIPVTGSGVDRLLAEKPFYSRALVPVAAYPGVHNDRDVETIGVTATMVTSAFVSDEAVYALTKELFDNLEEFRKLSPASPPITREGALEGLSAPIHPGALKYFKEAGWIP